MKRKNWTENELNYLKENWCKKPTKEIAKDLTRTFGSVYMKADYINLGQNKADKKRKWLEEDEEYLENNWGDISIPTLAKNLNRSESAILIKVQKLNLGRFLDSGDYITLNQLYVELRGMNQGDYTVQQWVDKGLPVKTRRVKNCSFKIIYLQDWWEWAEMNSTIIDFSRLEPLALGKEPKWLEDQRKADIENKYFKNSPWTNKEDNLLRTLLNKHQYTYREISLRLKRTEGAIKRRVVDLGIKARPLKMSNHNPWTEAETELLVNLYHKGHSRNTIPNYINRSSQACGGKIERLIKEGVIFPRSEFRSSC